MEKQSVWPAFIGCIVAGFASAWIGVRAVIYAGGALWQVTHGWWATYALYILVAVFGIFSSIRAGRRMMSVPNWITGASLGVSAGLVFAALLCAWATLFAGG